LGRVGKSYHSQFHASTFDHLHQMLGILQILEMLGNIFLRAGHIELV
jgi:hypothetical protein